ncbi:hypothetical protein KIW84_051549 [Lathyrus oleraceus]|uniref:DUF659 domain-containing protein n=1 Tax=Pisum sativum TaxID=3888 RepID=A0A9D5AAU3_PEA|nr:hypothetical protein KIW84_051549 [Pisum sativum]
MSNSYQRMIDAIAYFGPGYKGPNYHAMRTNLLSDMKKNVQLLLVEYVGPKNVVHLITDNAANYKSAGQKLHDKFGLDKDEEAPDNGFEDEKFDLNSFPQEDLGSCSDVIDPINPRGP